MLRQNPRATVFSLSVILFAMTTKIAACQEESITFVNKTPYNLELKSHFSDTQPDFLTTIAPHEEKQTDYGKSYPKNILVTVKFNTKTMNVFPINDLKPVKKGPRCINSIYFITEQPIMNNNTLASGPVAAYGSNPKDARVPRKIGESKPFTISPK